MLLHWSCRKMEGKKLTKLFDVTRTRDLGGGGERKRKGEYVFGIHFIRSKKKHLPIYTPRHNVLSIIKYLLLTPPQQYIYIHTYEIYYGIFIHSFNYDDNRVGNLILMSMNGRG